MTTTTTTAKKIEITLSEKRPVKIVADEWPVIARADDHDGQVQCQANTEWYIKVREHADGRRIVYCGKVAGNGGQYASFRPTRGGFIVDSSDKTRGPYAQGCEPDDEATIRAIRRCAGIIDRDDLGDVCIGDLPAEEI